MDAGNIKSISGTVKFCLFLNSNICLSITFSIFDEQKWFCTFYNAMAIEKKNLMLLTLNLGKMIAPVDRNDLFFYFQAELQSFSAEVKHLDTLCSASTGMSSCLIQDL